MIKRKGSALVYIMMIMVFISMLLFFVANMTNNNIRQASHQKDTKDGYYLARSGVELMYEHLKTNNFMDDFITKDSFAEAEFTDYEFGEDMPGKVDAKATAKSNPNPAILDRTVTIESIGKLDNGKEPTKLELTFDLVVKEVDGNKIIDSISNFRWSR